MSISIYDQILDTGLTGFAGCTGINICSAIPTNYLGSTVNYKLGQATGNPFAAPSSWATGRQVVAAAISGGSVNTSGNAIAWAAIDTVNSRLLATGSIASTPVVAGGTWNLATFTIQESHNAGTATYTIPVLTPVAPLPPVAPTITTITTVSPYNAVGTSVPSATITAYDGGVQVGTATADASGNWTCGLGTLASGSHSITATATTSTGTSVPSAPYMFTPSFNLSSTPFSAASLWNKKVPTGATYTRLNWPTSTGFNYNATWSHDSPPVYLALASDPLVAVTGPSGWGWPNNISINIPVGATGAVGGSGETNPDKPIIVIQPDGTAYNFWRFNRTSNTTATCQAYGRANVITDTGWGDATHGAGIVAAGSSEFAGLLVQAQSDTGAINHALQLAIDTSLLKPGYIAPAVGGDGVNSGGSVQEGQLLAIPPGTTMPSGLSPLGQKVFVALQQYGAYVTDNGTDQSALRAQANAFDTATMSALRPDLNVVLPLLQKVN